MDLRKFKKQKRMVRKEGEIMNKVYLDKKGNLFIDNHEIQNVKSVSVKTDWTGTNIIIEFKANYKSDFLSDVKEHSLTECSKG